MVWIAPASSGNDVSDHDGSRFRAIAFPKLLSVCSIVRGKIENPVNCDQVAGKTASPRGDLVDIPDHDSSSRCAVAFPKLGSLAAIGRKEKYAINISQVAWIATRVARIYILNHDRSCGSAICPPQLFTTDSVIGGKKQIAARRGQIL